MGTWDSLLNPLAHHSFYISLAHLKRGPVDRNSAAEGRTTFLRPNALRNIRAAFLSFFARCLWAQQNTYTRSGTNATPRHM